MGGGTATAKEQKMDGAMEEVTNGGSLCFRPLLIIPSCE